MSNNNIKFKDAHSEYMYLQKKIKEVLMLKEQEMKSEDFTQKFENEVKENLQDIKNTVKPIGTIKAYKYSFTPNMSNKQQLKDVSLLLTTSIDNQDVTVQFMTNGGDSPDVKMGDTVKLTNNINQFLTSVNDYYEKWQKYWNDKTNEYNNTITNPTV